MQSMKNHGRSLSAPIPLFRQSAFPAQSRRSGCPLLQQRREPVIKFEECRAHRKFLSRLRREMPDDKEVSGRDCGNGLAGNEDPPAAFDASKTAFGRRMAEGHALTGAVSARAEASSGTPRTICSPFGRAETNDRREENSLPAATGSSSSERPSPPLNPPPEPPPQRLRLRSRARRPRIFLSAAGQTGAGRFRSLPRQTDKEMIFDHPEAPDRRGTRLLTRR